VTKRILVVAGDSGLAKTRALVLAAGGYSTASALTTDEAIDKLRESKFDLVVWDFDPMMGEFTLDRLIANLNLGIDTLEVDTFCGRRGKFSTRFSDAHPASILKNVGEMFALQSGSRR
jgi:CheY-like chemotaxis protein